MYDFQAPLSAEALAAAKAFYAQLPALEHGMFFDHVPLHWAVEAFRCTDGAYNGEIVLTGKGKNTAWSMQITHDPLDNAIDIPEDGSKPYAAHTLGRNSHGFGLAITGMEGATSSDFGPEGLQYHQLEFLEAAAAAVCLKYGIQAGDRRAVYTHAEAAIVDGYYGERWDLAIVDPAPSFPPPQVAQATGNALRARIHSYKLALAQQLEVSV